jgi:hypothetical protein
MTDEDLKTAIAAQKALMIAVATGGPRIPSVNNTYVERRAAIAEALAARQLADPNPFDDLWAWYGRWQEPDLQHYQQRRLFIGALYKPLLDQLAGGARKAAVERVVEPTGWERVDRTVEKALRQFDAAQNEEDFQGVGLTCREVMISLAQAVYDPLIHKTSDGVKPSNTDANRMLEAFISHELKGHSNEALRKHAKASLGLAVELQHKRTAQYRDAGLCMEATASLVNIIAIVSGRREIRVVARPAKATTDTSVRATGKGLSGEYVGTRLKRILKLTETKAEVLGVHGNGGGGPEFHIPARQGEFALHRVGSGETCSFAYINTLSKASDIPKAMADVRVLLAACSRIRGTDCKFILVTDEELGAEKASVYETFEKMLATVPEAARGLLSIEVWDEAIVRGKETELLLRTDD